MAQLGKVEEKKVKAPERLQQLPAQLTEISRPSTSGSAAPSRASMKTSEPESAATPQTNDESAFPALPKVAPTATAKPKTAKEKRREKKEAAERLRAEAASASIPLSQRRVDASADKDAEATKSDTARGRDEKVAAPVLDQAPTPIRQSEEADHPSKAKEAATDGPNSKGKSRSANVEQDEPADNTETAPPKRQHPGKLDISAATEASKQAAMNHASTEIKSAQLPSSSTQVPSGTPSSSRPGTPSFDTPIRRVTQPRTLRVVGLSTPKAESPPVANSPGPVAAVKAQHSAQASVASPSVPGTPTGERIRDDLSITTGTLSRAGSPPPGQSRVGSAPVRTKTKNQLKKERQERAKAVEEEKIAAAVTETAAPDDSVFQEPIMGRKKKQKKEKAKPVKATPATATKEERKVVTEPQPAVEEPAEVTPPALPAPEEPAKVVEEPKIVEEESAGTSIAPVVGETRESPDNVKRSLLPELVQALEAGGETPSTALHDFFKPATALLHVRQSDGENLSLSEHPVPPQHPLTADELAALDSGKPVRRGDKIPARLIITPHSRKALKCLSPQQEERYLQLEQSLKDTKPGLKYSHRAKHESAKTVAGIVDAMLREITAELSRPVAAKSKGKASQTPSQSRGASASSERAKQPHYADDALAYLNQFILPTSAATTTRNGIGAAIPRTYTTGDPTYSVSGVDVSPSGYPNGSSSTYNYPAGPGQTANTGYPPATGSYPPNHANTLYPNTPYTNTAIAAAAAMASSSELPAAAAEAADKLAQNLAYGRSLGIDALEGNEGLKQTLEGLAGALSGALGSLGAGPLFAQAGQALGQQNGSAQMPRERDIEALLASCKKDTESLEKKLMGLVKKNRRMAGLS